MQKRTILRGEACFYQFFKNRIFVEFNIFVPSISILFQDTAFFVSVWIYADNRLEKGVHHIMHPRELSISTKPRERRVLTFFFPFFRLLDVCVSFFQNHKTDLKSLLPRERERTQQMSRPEPEEERRICEIEKTRLEMQTQIMFKKFLV